MTIRHPAKVKNILASGVDSLVISMGIEWKDESFFIALEELKEKAKQYSLDYPGNIKHFNNEEVYPFTIKPNGTKGFSWILNGADFTYKIANSVQPGSRPNGMIEFRSEALWRLGPADVLRIALNIIEANGGHIIKANLSRVDLCLDFLMPEERWAQDLADFVVSRATDSGIYKRNNKLTGIRIGKGIISARLYDKPLEIEQQSKKVWMFDIWGLEEVPEGKKVIRIEFQLRREVLKELGIKTANDLLQKNDQVWAYCTKNWLKFQDRPGLHHTQRSTFRWYEEIQDGFQGIQGAEPLIREKAVSMDKKRLMQQVNGLVLSLHAIDQEEKGEDQDKPVNMEDCIRSYKCELTNNYPDQAEIQTKMKKKRSKYHRETPPIEKGQTLYELRRSEKYS